MWWHVMNFFLSVYILILQFGGCGTSHFAHASDLGNSTSKPKSAEVSFDKLDSNLCHCTATKQT